MTLGVGLPPIVLDVEHRFGEAVAMFGFTLQGGNVNTIAPQILNICTALSEAWPNGTTVGFGEKNGFGITVCGA